MLLIAGAVGLALALAIFRGTHEQFGMDFHVFWQAGRNFMTGAPLYHGDLPGARHFIYPPFAALVFEALALFPLRVAATLFSFLNLALVPVAISRTKRIVAATFPGRNPSAIPLIAAAALTFVFFQDNFNHAQMNEVVFVLILLGMYAYVRERDVAAAVWLVLATAIKVKPVFAVVWLVLRGRRRAAVAVVPAALACVVIPLLLRGPTRGFAELREYYESFLHPYQQGAVVTRFTNQSLGALVYRAMRPEETQEHLDYAYLPASEDAARHVARASSALVLVLFLAMLAVLRLRRAPVSAFELSAVFLVGDLLSPISWKAHLVTLLFVFYTFLAIDPATLRGMRRLGLFLLWGLIALSGLSGRDLVGPTAFLYIGGYSVVVWTMLVLFVTAVVIVVREATRGGWSSAPAT